MIDKKYINIINLPHHVSKKHPQMSMEERAAQFAPFAALTGYDDDIKETGRYVSSKKDLNEEKQRELDSKLHILKEKILSKPKIKCIYYVPDLYKDGGEYKEHEGNIAKIDEYNKQIIFEDKNKIYISDIIEIELIEK